VQCLLERQGVLAVRSRASGLGGIGHAKNLREPPDTVQFEPKPTRERGEVRGPKSEYRAAKVLLRSDNLASQARHQIGAPN
jgi:hypothetical protein